MGIRGQLTLLVPSIVAAALAWATYAELRSEERESLAEFRLRSHKVLQAIAVTAVSLTGDDRTRLGALVTQIKGAAGEHELIDLAILDSQGLIVAHSQAERVGTVATDSFSQQALRAEASIWEREGDALRLAEPVASDVRRGTVTGSYSLQGLNEQLQQKVFKLALSSAALFAIAGALLFFGLEKLVMRPLRTLRQTVRKMGEGHLSVRSPPLRGSELAELSEALNAMASTLQAERESLERTVADRTRELQEANVRLERLAASDGLTGVYNHRRFQEQLQTEILRSERHKRPLAVLMVDVDHFKKVNDTLGHPVGDEVLRQLAEVLGHDLRQTDLIARYGGEEFAVLLPETSRSEAMQVAERMRAAVESAMTATPRGINITVSIGVATFPEDAKGGEQLVIAADQAMYVAKRQGRNRVVSARGAVG